MRDVDDIGFGISTPKWLVAAALGATLLQAPALAQEAAAPVIIAQATETEIKQVQRLTGSVTARQNAQLSVATAGLITDLLVDAGDYVDTGDLLMELDAELARHQHDSALAAEAQARSALADARRRLEEARRLAPKQSIAETVLKNLAAEVAEDEAALAQSTALARYREGIHQRHRLYAPFPGVISQRSVELGEWVAPGQRVLGLVSNKQLRLDFQVPEDFLGKVTIGTPVRFTLGAEKAVFHAGSVKATVPVTDPTGRTFLVRVVPETSIDGMMPGMSARAEFSLDSGRRGVTVPRDAILRYSDGRVAIWVVEQLNGVSSAAERLVEIGLSFDDRVEIRGGLSAGTRVVVKGNESLRNGQLLAIRPTVGG